eukprot:TRINITY_DN8656_c0_g1_i1.p1 TRINITY_DN8656_c0_g1~~TRINITY_DN8656_c0_g1_i1.p1  ORF type:complete len:498 (-),score=57.95 TRINITY_DN8656_c0_g1_i1:103-1596(-)
MSAQPPSSALSQDRSRPHQASGVPSSAVAKRSLSNASSNPSPTKRPHTDSFRKSHPEAFAKAEKELTDRLLANCPSQLGHTWGKKVYNSFSVVIVLPGSAGSQTILVQPLILPIMGDTLKKKFDLVVQDDKNSLTLNLPPEFEARHLILCFKFFYFRKIEYSDQEELVQILKVAAFFHINPVVQACDFLLPRLPVDDAIGIFSSVQSGNPSGQASTLLPNIRESIVDIFRDLDHLPEKFLDLHHSLVRMILETKNLRISTENPVFCAMRRWIHHDFDIRKLYLEELCDCVVFHKIQKNYLLDVVDRERHMAYPPKGKSKLVAKLFDAMRHHVSGDTLRHMSMPPAPILREYDSSKFVAFLPLKLEGVSGMSSFSSKMFCFNGYYFSMTLRKSDQDQRDKQTLGFYLTLCVSESGLGKSFYVPIAFDLETRRSGGKFYSNRGTNYSPFTSSRTGWGFKDAFGKPWMELLDSPYCQNDQMTLRLQISFFSKAQRPPSRG